MSEDDLFLVIASENADARRRDRAEVWSRALSICSGASMDAQRILHDLVAFELDNYVMAPSEVLAHCERLKRERDQARGCLRDLVDCIQVEHLADGSFGEMSLIHGHATRAIYTAALSVARPLALNRNRIYATPPERNADHD